MSDLNPGAVSLEDDGAPPPAQETPAPVAETPAPPPPVVDDDPEGTIEGSGGVKFVPLGAVVETRGKLKERTAELEAAKAENETLKQAKQRLDAIQAEWNAVQPLVQSLKNGTYQPQQQQKSAEVDPGMIVGEHPITGAPITLLQYTQGLDLYKTDGTPDIDRGLHQIGVQRYQAKQQTQREMAPLHQQTAYQQANVLRQQVLQIKDTAGQMVNPAYLEKVFAGVPPEMAARPEIASVLYYAAKGMEAHEGKAAKVITPPGPVVQTETLGGGAPGRSEVSQFERNFLQAADMKPKEYETISSRYKSGERNELE